VTQGTINANTQWALVTPGPITLGTTALTFAVETPVYEYDPRAYGAVCDGSFDANGLIFGTDDTAAWDAMMTAIINSPVPGKKRIRLPPGYMYIAGHAWTKGCFKLEIPVSVHIEGTDGAGINGTGGLSNSGFILAPMCSIVFCNGGASDLLPGT